MKSCGASAEEAMRSQCPANAEKGAIPLTMMCSADSNPLTVLAADDDPAALRLIANIASAAGCRVIEAKDGQEAWDRILEHSPDVLVTDWDMPGLDGPQLCRRLRQANLPFCVYVLLLTAKSRAEDLVEGLDAGADDFISKPVDPTVFMARLRVGSRTIAMDRQLREIARLDPLTGLMNRRSFHEQFSTEWGRASRYGHPLSCAMIDLDFFKSINDAHGHAAGDLVLQRAVRALDGCRRASDVLARYGGEEFCVFLAETDESGAAAWAERARLVVAEARSPSPARF